MICAVVGHFRHSKVKPIREMPQMQSRSNLKKFHPFKKRKMLSAGNSCTPIDAKTVENDKIPSKVETEGKSKHIPVSITRDLLKKRSEHNDMDLTTLEEISLHQFNIEEIGSVLQNQCKRLKILLLQSNQICKIGNN
jgi:hypothetical protein